MSTVQSFSPRVAWNAPNTIQEISDQFEANCQDLKEKCWQIDRFTESCRDLLEELTPDELIQLTTKDRKMMDREAIRVIGLIGTWKQEAFQCREAMRKTVFYLDRMISVMSNPPFPDDSLKQRLAECENWKSEFETKLEAMQQIYERIMNDGNFAIDQGNTIRSRIFFHPVECFENSSRIWSHTPVILDIASLKSGEEESSNIDYITYAEDVLDSPIYSTGMEE